MISQNLRLIMNEIASGWAEPDVFTKPLFEQLKRHPKRIVFSEGEDERIVKVAGEMVRLELGIPILLGKKDKIRGMLKEQNIPFDFIRIIDPLHSDDLEHFTEMLARIEKLKGMNLANPKEVMSRPQFFAAMMIQYGHADGMVGGNQLLPEAIFRAVTQLVKPMPKVPHIFSAAVMVSEDMPHFGPDGVLYLADCGITDQPTVQELTHIAVETGRLAHHYAGRRIRVAMLSHSTMNSGSSDSATRVRAAAEGAQVMALQEGVDLEVDGELQADVALVPEAAEYKFPQMVGRPSADVLVFPNLDAAHISMKLLRHLGGATKYGQFILGLTRPAAQVPRTAPARSILGTAVAVGAEAIKYHELFPEG